MLDTCLFETLFTAPLRNGVSYAAKLRGRGIPMVNMKEIFAYDRIADQECELVPLTAAEHKVCLLEAGDLLFARQSLTYEGAGKCVLVLDGARERTWESHLIRVRLDSTRALAEYYFYYFRSPQGRRSIETIIQQVAAAGIRGSDLRRLIVPCPPVHEQRAISAMLGALDNKIAANAKLSAAAEGLATALFAKSVHGLDLAVSTFGDIAAVRGGGTPRTGIDEYWDGDINWVTPTDVTALAGPYLEGTSRRITTEGLQACASPLYPTGSILMTSRATIGAFAVAQQPTATNQGFIVVNPHDSSLKWWIFHEMRARVDEFISLANGATFLELSRGNFKKFRVRLAEPSVMNAFGVTAEALHSRARQALVENAHLADVRDVLLPQLMSGKIRVKDIEQMVGDVV